MDSLIQTLTLNRDEYEVEKIIQLGITCYDMVKKYSNFKIHNIEANHIFNEEINSMNINISNLKKEKEELQNLLQSQKELFEKEHNKLIIENDLSIHKATSSIKNTYTEEISLLQSQIQNLLEKSYLEKNTLREEITNEMNSRIINLQNTINDIKLEKNNDTKFLKDLLDKSDNQREIEKNKLINEYTILINQYKEETQKYRNKYEKIEVNSTLKGKGYEVELEKELKDFFDKNGNVYKIDNCSNTKGKGDFIITNNYSNIRIMLEAKNMDKVKSYDKEQLPKFYNDVRDKTNKYDGAIMIASGTISSKKNYLIEIMDDNKIVSFIEKYTLNQPEKINCMIEIMHNKIKDIQNTSNLSKDKIIEIMIQDYKNLLDALKYTKQSFDIQEKCIKEKRENINNLFQIDVDEYILNKNRKNVKLSKSIKDKVEDYILLNKSKMNKQLLTKNIMKEFSKYIDLYNRTKDKENGIPKGTITRIITKHFKEESSVEITLSNN